MDVLRSYINSIRRDFANRPLDENSVPENPYQLFEQWFEDAVGSEILDPYAMMISTADEHQQPSSRVVYMRDISESGIIFYTNYLSHKGHDLSVNHKISALFFWVELERQIRIEGIAEPVSPEISDAYFASRPRESQIGAWASAQSSEIESREELERLVLEYTEKFKDQEVPRPPHWGGYLIRPEKFEFWQGRPSRLHDRITFKRDAGTWQRKRLAP
ncbi:MAG: pyridoxamine 5'-phosphate oxidase [Flavobacteriales bacterium]|nr:pyridoxamine 5'-phosphate oxidase [Flavobacteriales bacterium]